MRRLRSHRLTITLFVVFSLLFSQLALAQYACPQQARMGAMATMAASGPSCEGMDAQQPSLCHQHAADPGKTCEAMKQLPDVSVPAVVQVIELPLVPEDQGVRGVPPMGSSEVPPPPEPLFLATLRLRV